jgi:pyruvate dehydrogenase E2 component (dihydrolipoamide acetyltransferase)
MMRATRSYSARQVLRVATRGLALPPHTVVGLPALSPTMTQGNIASYVAKIGDQLTTGDRLAEIETDKATVDFEATDDGFLAQILIPAGTSDVPVGTPMLVLCTSAADVPAFANFKAEGASAAPAKAAAPASAPAKAAPAAAPTPAPAPTVASAAPPPPRAAAAAPTSLAGVALPALGGKIYYNPTKGESCTPLMPRACARIHPFARGAPDRALLNLSLTTCILPIAYCP